MKLSRRSLLIGAGGAVVGAAAVAGGFLSRDGKILFDNKSRAKTITADTELPERVDVAVIGGGLAGIITALELNEKGTSVAVFEKGYVAAEQSSRAFGWVSSMGDLGPTLALSHESKKFWHSINDRIGADTSFRVIGNTNFLTSDEQIANQEEWIKEAKNIADVDARIISGSEMESRLGGATSTNWKAAIYQETDGGLEPPIAGPTLAEYARSIGVKIYQECAVRGIETSGGKVSAVVTENGTVKCDAAVVAGGMWSRRFLGNLDISIPQLGVFSSVQAMETKRPGPLGVGSAGDAAWRKRIDGSYSVSYVAPLSPIVPDSFKLFPEFIGTFFDLLDTVHLDLSNDFIKTAQMATSWDNKDKTPFEKLRVFNIQSDDKRLEASAEAMREEFTNMAGSEVTEKWGGYIDATPDSVPIIDGFEAIPGLFVCTGFSGHGLAMIPAASRLTADLVTGDKPILDSSKYALARF